MITVPFALSRTLDLADYDILADELTTLDQVISTEAWAGQHPHRRWEYALALRALRTWYPGHRHDARVVDVGGAGSPWPCALQRLGYPTVVIDPALPEGGCSLHDYLAICPTLCPVVTCLSVLEHVPDLDEFVGDLEALVAPGGLLMLTLDYSPRALTDTCHFSWMRQRLFNGATLTQLEQRLRRAGFVHLAGSDCTDHGPQVYDYTFASLVLARTGRKTG